MNIFCCWWWIWIEYPMIPIFQPSSAHFFTKELPSQLLPAGLVPGLLRCHGLPRGFCDGCGRCADAGDALGGAQGTAGKWGARGMFGGRKKGFHQEFSIENHRWFLEVDEKTVLEVVFFGSHWIPIKTHSKSIQKPFKSINLLILKPHEISFKPPLDHYFPLFRTFSWSRPLENCWRSPAGLPRSPTVLRSFRPSSIGGAWDGTPVDPKKSGRILPKTNRFP